MSSPTVYARRSLCYLFMDQPDAALSTMCCTPSLAHSILHAISCLISKLGIAMHKDAADMLNEAAQLEEKRQRTAKASLRIKHCAILFVIDQQSVAVSLHGTR